MKTIRVKNRTVLPLTITTKKISPTKTDSIFYEGKDIASIKILNREYVLTTAGEYEWIGLDGRKAISRSRLTDKIIAAMDKDDLKSNWGWFGINVWVDEKCLDYPTDCIVPMMRLWKHSSST
jgi:hypothetical protein